MNWQRIWNDPVWSKVIAGAILAAASLAIALFPQSPISVGGLAVLALVGAGLLVWTIVRYPIAWKFDNFLGLVGSRGEVRVVGFQATGRNRSRSGFHRISGHLLSNIDNTLSGPMEFVIAGNRVPVTETTGVPAGATFQIAVPLCDMSRGYEAYIPEYEFLQRWAAFRFVVEFDGNRFEKRFSHDQVLKRLDDFKKVALPPPKPEVRRKQ